MNNRYAEVLIIKRLCVFIVVYPLPPYLNLVVRFVQCPPVSHRYISCSIGNLFKQTALSRIFHGKNAKNK
ncbi:hypothetical protein EDWATA_01607 [Edwardsiella tarda ATCC 23685]|uniref:Uncharacterized protein n=1 Tax=Edwardsiella tarda ATCC 23685 TaxID=500638 RepID=D4F4D6_EDWTA|nr:hypothetical protein EDWATA_01607 [Edwardsiella tarda ATCC 23685]